MTQREPTANDAAAIVATHFGTDIASVERFPTGLANYVYDVATVDGRRVVARLQRRGAGSMLQGAVFWSQLLRPHGIPLPELYAHDLAPPDDGFPYMLLERLPGQDLEHVYPMLSSDQKGRLAQRVAMIQRRVATLPRGRGFGYGASFDDPGLHPTWRDVLIASLERSRSRIAAAGVVSTEWVDRVAERLPAIEHHIAAIEPIPFLDDMTVKNVLVHNGELSGLVDVDWVCFGDPLFTVALTRMALLARREETDYIDFWAAELDLSAEQRAALAFYTALFCVDFLSELGHRFNQTEAIAANLAEVGHLVAMLRRLLGEC
jgi:Ser/Thr protein kinase RdoA (MazF antagonist)